LAPAPQTYLAEGKRPQAQTLLEPATHGFTEPVPLVGCIVGASVANKAWPVERWVELSRGLSAQGMRPVLLGGPGETETANEIARQSGGTVALNLAGQTPIPVLASVLAQCAVVVGGDSGPTHLAVAVGTPVVGLYGVTDPVRTGPKWGHAPAIVLDYAQSDAPPEFRRPRHPTLSDALARIPAEAVVSAVDELLKGRATC
jgi:ADP-heptose:LPS heptosyltransferase